MTEENQKQKNEHKSGAWIWIVWTIIWWATAFSVIDSIHGIINWYISIFLLAASLGCARVAWLYILYQRGYNSFIMEKYAKADDVFTRVRKHLLLPWTRFARICNIGLTITRFMLGDFAGAIEYAKKALKSRRLGLRYRKSVLIYLYSSLIRIGRQDETNEIIEQIEQMPGIPDLDPLYTLNRAYEQLVGNRPSEALSHMETIAVWEGAVTSCTFNAMMVYALRANDRNAEAQPYLAKVKQAPNTKFDFCLKLYPLLAPVLNEARVSEEPRKNTE